MVPIARLKTAEIGPSFLGRESLSDICAIRGQDLNAIRKV